MGYRCRANFLFSLLVSLGISRLHIKTRALSHIREAWHLKVVALIMNELELMLFIIYVTVYYVSLVGSHLRKDTTCCWNRQLKEREGSLQRMAQSHKKEKTIS